ncbi:stage V sporulation T C-terminal domain-containing protein [Anaeromassilibacillus senegalensis]|uniref:stage V sporulation T C-terminal domain-containing protein n=1 Tax=Anaeromassilibacillus senegalensis TaxID=1673717 RepID=UPI0006810CB4|nr:stage V sporulation T C-terminal domain-containing protein [Anaeromassilibacillus senegalensis]
MKATGIVRRIDDLGRVVIPKEIRRTLRIFEGDALEIFTDAQGGVTFKKYSPVGELAAFAEQYAEVLSNVTGKPSVICDKDHVIAAGISRKEYIGRRVSVELDDYLQEQKSYICKENDEKLYPIEGIDKVAGVVYPIVVSSEIMGAVVLLQDDEFTPANESEEKLTRAAASFLSKQMEK